MVRVSNTGVVGVCVEIDHQYDRRGAQYIVYADGRPVAEKRTIKAAKRAADAFVGKTVFALSGEIHA